MFRVRKIYHSYCLGGSYYFSDFRPHPNCCKTSLLSLQQYYYSIIPRERKSKGLREKESEKKEDKLGLSCAKLRSSLAS